MAYVIKSNGKIYTSGSRQIGMAKNGKIYTSNMNTKGIAKNGKIYTSGLRQIGMVKNGTIYSPGLRPKGKIADIKKQFKDSNLIQEEILVAAYHFLIKPIF